jgi:hypothetical protein
MKQVLNIATVLALLALLTATASARPVVMPDAGSTSILLAAALGGLTVVRRFVR